MKQSIALVFAVVLLDCRAADTINTSKQADAAPLSDVASAAIDAGNLGSYKLGLAQRIASANADKVYTGRPQALLRSVIVIRYKIDGNGNLVHFEIIRSNQDSAMEAVALASLQNSAPFPRPGAHLLQQGSVDLAETWLFNNDGRFQLRTIAQPQMGE